jgi:MOSC domain-containing protein YiiM
MRNDTHRGRIEAIWLKRAKRAPMDAVDSAVADNGYGLRGNANRGGRRQITLIARERWTELASALGGDLDPVTRRANVLISGVDLVSSRDRLLRLGEVVLRINGETRPCEQMEEAHAGLQALMRERWGGGAFAEVVEGGTLRVGDPVNWLLPLLDGT